jgi:hypothetical protein
LPRVGFEPMIPALERARTVHALDRAATVISISTASIQKLKTGLLLSRMLPFVILSLLSNCSLSYTLVIFAILILHSDL